MTDFLFGEGMPLLLLALLWLAYFGLHSLLADRQVRAAFSLLWPALGRRYRLVYNGLAVLTLIPPLLLLYAESWTPVWAATGYGRVLTDGLALLALAGIWRVAGHYDMRGFLGVNGGSTADGLRLSPWHRHVRHPWYALALVLIWTRPMDRGMLLTAVLMTGYFIVGARLEERKLEAAFGEAYRRYRARVPAFCPWPGRRLSPQEAAALEAEAARPQ